MINFKDDNIKCVYLFGSRLYGTHNVHSDYDYIIVCEKWFDSEDINHHVYTVEQFQSALDRCDIQALECYFSPASFKIKEDIKFKFELDKTKLRTSISTIASNSYVKCKKKLIVSGDYDLKLAVKSMFHSLRIIDFGIQIASYGFIFNYKSSNFIYNDLLYLASKYQRDELWNKIDTKYRKIYNSRSSSFKLLCPKELTKKDSKHELINLFKTHEVTPTDDLINDILNMFL